MQITEQIGIENVRCVWGGKHPKITGIWHGRPISLVVPASPSDRRGIKNFKKTIRRVIANAFGNLEHSI